MDLEIRFFMTAVALGIGLAMDAFSISLVNGLNDPFMKLRKMCIIAGFFGFFQALMPMLGWICIRTILQRVALLEAIVPWISCLLLGCIGISMLRKGSATPIENSGRKLTSHPVGLASLLLQAVATSIDALSVGFTIADEHLVAALLSAGIIAIMTFIICLIGLCIGKTAGTHLAGKAERLGGCILIAIGIEILLTNLA